MPLLEYWNCPGGHIVLRQYMPQSGVTCNVQGCNGERKKYLATVTEEAKAADAFIDIVFNNIDAPMHWFFQMANAEMVLEKEIERSLEGEDAHQISD